MPMTYLGLISAECFPSSLRQHRLLRTSASKTRILPARLSQAWVSSCKVPLAPTQAKQKRHLQSTRRVHSSMRKPNSTAGVAAAITPGCVAVSSLAPAAPSHNSHAGKREVQQVKKQHQARYNHAEDKGKEERTQDHRVQGLWCGRTDKVLQECFCCSCRRFVHQ